MQATADLRRARIISSVAATVIALACGSNYVYSAWGPQFAEKLKLSATESNLVGLFGNLGMYSLGAPVGILVDGRGPRPAVFVGAILMIAGYFPLHMAYDRGSGSVALLCLFSFLSGLGGCTAFSSAVKVSALNWPESRGTATAFPLAAFGLSAFFFSLIGGLFFPGDTSDFLMLLAIGPCSMTFTGFFFLKVYPHSSYEPLPADNEDDEASDEHHARLQRTSSKESKARRDDTETGMYIKASLSAHPPASAIGDVTVVDIVDPRAADETSSLLPRSSHYQTLLGGTIIDSESLRPLDLRGMKLLASLEFWQLFFIMAILSGIGIMTINNIGNDAKALWEHHDKTVTPRFLVARQQMHVSILSICSFLGRLLSGVGSDFLVNNLQTSRVWCLFIATLIFTLAQVCALTVENPHLLWFVSSLSGLGYGFLFGVFPSLMAESFGVHGLGQNWGYITLAPVISSNIFNIFYGWVYDRHTTVQENGEHICFEGLECYKAAYWMTLVSCGLGFVVTIWAIRSQHAKLASHNSKGDEED